jgi:hypothetical protein
LINAAQILSIAHLPFCSPDRFAIPATSQTTESKFIKRAVAECGKKDGLVPRAGDGGMAEGINAFLFNLVDCGGRV